MHSVFNGSGEVNQRAMEFQEWATRELKPGYLSLIQRIEEEVGSDRCTLPFVPYVGSGYEYASPRIFVVGKATYGWGKGRSGQGGATLRDVLGREDLYEYLATLPTRFMEKEIIPFYGGESGRYHSQFWNRIYRLAGNLLLNRPVSEYRREPETSEECFRSIAWSNVFKVGATKAKGGNPRRRLASIQKSDNTLAREIEVLQPDVVIFSTGPGYDRHLKDVLPNITLRQAGPDHLGIKEVEGLRTLAFRAYHFQSFSNYGFEQAVHHIRGRMDL
jgi:hypothetical protein